MQSLINQIIQYEKFSSSELETITSKFVYNKYKSKEYILKEGDTSTQLHFIVMGLVRVFHLKEGKEITTYLASDNGFVSSYSSFINQTKSFEFVQCLEDTETFSIQYKDMHELYERVPRWQKIGRILSEGIVICLAERLLKIHSVTAREKYLDFLKNSPEKIVKRTPLIHIASFLGVAPESLSRIRKGIS
ncbi:Crp/Fnr family transcriptional regulator [Cytophagaceae bacterium YF14B1]|uniref:Crp/Fnr family transcriptional regulator n=1 Tax=Xanthocytophaga flava TaxID=3048013 RepID=A0AAE3U6R0_9BACT|nr:Crp/Fnr family transcriptional regulator [Xanthocytophaga flavus]MDJ1481576.1 Crp/Fnr family transcriptional regulator [Xanthocytophaga flavus]